MWTQKKIILWSWEKPFKEFKCKTLDFQQNVYGKKF